MARPDMELAREILEFAESEYPNPYAVDELNGQRGKDLVTATAHYLVEHELLEGTCRNRMGTIDSYADVRLTARGVDYLSNDGGLTAELGVMTVRLEAESIRDLVMARAELAGLPNHEKNLLRAQLEELPKEALQHLSKRLIDAGLAAAPLSLQWLRTQIGL